MSTTKIPARSEVQLADTWSVEVLYDSISAWEADFDTIDAKLAPLADSKGSLSSPEALAAFYTQEDELDRLLGRVYCYAHLRHDEDTADPTNQSNDGKIRAKYAQVMAGLAWTEPELLGLPDGTLEAWMKEDCLAPFRYQIEKLLRHKAHTLSEAEETLMSKASPILQAPSSIFSMLNNADIRFNPVKDENGDEQEMSHGRYVKFLESSDRTVRKAAFDSMYDTFGAHRNTLATTLGTKVKAHNFNADVRGFQSARHAALHQNFIPETIYDALIEATHDALPIYYDYMKLRASALGLEKLDMYDMYVPMVADAQMEISFDQAREWILESCKPLGDEYCAALKGAFDDRWIDRYENRGKRSGAYSSGCYESYPYILMNYSGKLDDVFTLTHELGHSMHSYLANQNQSSRFANYTIFVAEIASTLNEALLLDYLLKTQPDPSLQAYLLNHLCDSFKGTVYRQTMFAAFEHMIHDMDAKQQPLTSDHLGQEYGKLNQLFYGPTVVPDEQIQLEWSRIPHFYYNFYVYQYATSFCASQVLVKDVLAGKVDDYLNMLRSGGSGDSLGLVQQAGVDLSDASNFRSAFETFQATVAKLGQAITT